VGSIPTKAIMKPKIKKQKPFRMTVLVSKACLNKDQKPNWPSVVYVEQLEDDTYKLVLESTDWRWLIRVVEHMKITIGIKSHPVMEYLGPYANPSALSDVVV
jgi:hypothetical protein